MKIRVSDPNFVFRTHFQVCFNFSISRRYERRNSFAFISTVARSHEVTVLFYQTFIIFIMLRTLPAGTCSQSRSQRIGSSFPPEDRPAASARAEVN